MESELRQRHQPVSVCPETGMNRSERRRLNADNLRSRLEGGGLSKKHERRARELGLLQAKMVRHSAR